MLCISYMKRITGKWTCDGEQLLTYKLLRNVDLQVDAENILADRVTNEEIHRFPINSDLQLTTNADDSN